MTRCLTTAALGVGAGCLFAGFLLVTTVAVAGTPYGPPMMPAYSPPMPAYSPPMPAYNPPMPAYNPPMQAFGLAGAPASGALSPRPRPGQIRMRQERTEDQYLLIIDLDGLPPENVDIRPFGRSLMVRTRVDARARRSESFDDGRGYRERYRVSTGSSTRRLPVPPDGDLAGLVREESAEQVRVMIPRDYAASSWR